MQHEPNMPREAAEYQVSLHRMHRDPSTRLRWELPGIETIEQLATGEPAALFASWLLGRSPRTQILRLIELGHAPAAAAPLAGSGLGDRYYRFVVLGVVPDGEYAAHVVYRDEADETTPWPGDAGAHLATLPADEQQLTRQLMARSHARLAFCRREPDHSWLLVADHQFMGVESTSIASIAVNDGVPESSPDALST